MAGVDPVLCSQQPEPQDPICAIPENVPLQGILTDVPCALPSGAAAETSARRMDGDKL
jgi:hypothetical protein